jgi:hypothetical protein
MRDICVGCKAFVDIVYIEEGTDRPFCQPCALSLPPSSEELALIFLQLTIPYKVGDRVVARQALSIDEFRTEGVGTVQEVSTSLEHGATCVYPTFLVTIEEPAYEGAPADGWFCEVNLLKAEDDSH